MTTDDSDIEIFNADKSRSLLKKINDGLREYYVSPYRQSFARAQRDLSSSRNVAKHVVGMIAPSTWYRTGVPGATVPEKTSSFWTAVEAPLNAPIAAHGLSCSLMCCNSSSWHTCNRQ